MDYLVYDERLSYDISGEQGVTDLKEINSLFQGTQKTVAVAVVSVEPNLITSVSADPEEIEKAAVLHYSSDSLLQYEALGDNEYQIFGIEEQLLVQIKQNLSAEKIHSIIPYAVALRAFIKQSKISITEDTIFLDDRGDAILFSVFNGERISRVRRLPIQDSRMVNELIRSAQAHRNLLEKQDIVFSVMTNRPQIRQSIMDLCDHPIINKDKIRVVEAPYPAIAGMKAEKSLLHFLLPEDIRKIQEEKNLRWQSTALIASVSICALAFLFFFAALMQSWLIKRGMSFLTSKEKDLTAQLNQAYVEKHISIVKETGAAAALLSNLENFLKKLPSYLYEINSIEVAEYHEGRFLRIVVIKKSEIKYARQHLQENFPNTKIYDTVIKDAQGHIILLELPKGNDF